MSIGTSFNEVQKTVCEFTFYGYGEMVAEQVSQ